MKPMAGTLVRTIGWYLTHAALLAAAFIAAGPLRVRFAAVVAVTLAAVATLGWLRAKRARHRFPLYYAVAVGSAGLSLSLLLLGIDWAAGAGDRPLTAQSFLSHILSAITSAVASAGLIIIAPCAMLLIAAAAGSYFGSWRSSDA